LCFYFILFYVLTTNFFILYPMEATNNGFTTNCSFVKCFAQSLLSRAIRWRSLTHLSDSIFSFIFSIVYCVAYKCKTISGQGIRMFEFPKDDKRRTLCTIRPLRNNGFTTNCSFVKCFAQSLLSRAIRLNEILPFYP
jgi:hypothetical protein